MRARAVGRVGTAVLLLLLVGWFAILRPVSLGGPATYLVVRGDSMLPTYQTGDLVVLRAAPEYTAGEIVAYRVPGGEVGAGIVVVHRIVGGDGQAGYVMRGDNNSSSDPWRPKTTDVAGTAWLYLPGVGRLLAFLHQPFVAGALAASVVVGWVIGRTPRRREAAQTGPAVRPATADAAPALIVVVAINELAPPHAD